MMTLVLHIYPDHGRVNTVTLEADLEQPWDFNLLWCDACKIGKCVQTTIVSTNYEKTIVVHGLTSAPLCMVRLDPPPEGSLGVALILTREQLKEFTGE